MQSSYKLILASSSLRRKILLESIGIVPDQIVSPDINEAPIKRDTPQQTARRLATEKAKAASLNIKGNAFIIAADTIMATKAKIFGKALSLEQAKEYLKFFSGRRIKVHSAVAVAKIQGCDLVQISSKLVTSDLKFKRVSDEELKNYFEKVDFLDKAGGFSIQNYGETLLESITGSYSGIVGLPLTQTLKLLKGLGYNDKTHCSSKD